MRTLQVPAGQAVHQVEAFELDRAGPNSDRGLEGLVQSHAGDAHGGAALRVRKDLERALGEDTQATQAADHELRQIEASGVLDDLGAAADDLAPAVDEGHGEQEVPQAAVAQPAGAVRSRRNGAAYGAAGFHEQGIERQVLPLGLKPALDLGERGAGQGGHRVLARQVLRNARESRQVEHLGAVHDGQRRLGTAAARDDQLRTANGFGNLGRRTRLMDNAGHRSPGHPSLNAPPRLIRAR